MNPAKTEATLLIRFSLGMVAALADFYYYHEYCGKPLRESLAHASIWVIVFGIGSLLTARLRKERKTPYDRSIEFLPGRRR